LIVVLGDALVWICWFRREIEDLGIELYSFGVVRSGFILWMTKNMKDLYLINK